MVGTLSFLSAFSTPPRIFWKSKQEMPKVLCTASFLCAFSPPPFFGNRTGSPRVVGHPQLSVCFFTPPPRSFSKSKWQIQDLLGTLNFLSTFSLNPLSIFWKSRSSWAPSTFSVPFHSTPPRFFGNPSGSPGVGGHLQLSVRSFTPLPFFINRSGKSRRKWAPWTFCVVFRCPHHFLEIEEVVGTLKFLSTLSLPPHPFFGNRSGKSRNCWTPSTFCMPFHSTPPRFFGNRSKSPGVGGHLQLSVRSLTPPPRHFLGKRTGKSRRKWAPWTFCVVFRSPPPHFLEIEVASPGSGVHPQLSVCFFTPSNFFSKSKWQVQELLGTFNILCALSRPPPIFWKSKWKSRSWWAPSAFCAIFHTAAPHFLEIEVEVQELVGTLNFFCVHFTPRPVFFWKSKWQIQEFVGTLSFLSAVSTPPSHFLEIDVANPRVRGHPELFVYFFPPPPHFLVIEMQVEEFVSTVSFLCALSHPSLNFFSKSKWQIPELVRTLSFLSAFSTPLRHFLEIEVPNPGSGVHPKLFLCLFTPPPSFFWKSKWQIQKLVGTLHSLSAFSFQPLPPFFGNRTGSPGLGGHPKIFVWLFTPPHQFLEIEVANHRVGGHAELSVCLFTAGPIFAKSNWTSRSSWAPSFFCALFHPPPYLFSKSKWQIQKAVGTLKFLCIFTLSPRFFGNESGKSRSWWAPSALCVPFHSPPKFFLEIKVANRIVGGHPEFSVCLFTPPLPAFFRNRSGSPGVGGHRQLSVCFLPSSPVLFWKSKWQIQQFLGILNYSCAFSLHPPPIFWKSNWKSRTWLAP